MHRLWLIAGLAATAIAAGPATAAVQTGDWPCVQVRVPSLSMGTFWTGQPIDEAAAKAAWRDDADVAKLVARLISRRTPVDDAEQAGG